MALVLREQLLGSSARMTELRERVKEAAAIDAPVLIEGERGTGRERVARLLHEIGPRKNNDFVRVDPDDDDEPPRVDDQLQRANGGTLLVKEIAHVGRGPQRKLLREGTYPINLAQFCVITSERAHYLPLEHSEEATFAHMAQLIETRRGFEPVVIKDADDSVGVVTVHDGPSLSEGQIIADTVGDDPNQASSYHNNFQDPEAFLRAGGCRGRKCGDVTMHR